MKRRTFIAAAAFLAAAPGVVFAQDARRRRIAFVDRSEDVANMTEAGHPYWGALISELRRLGHIEGESITIERWSGEGVSVDRIAALARTVAASQPDLVVARGGRLIRAFRAATETIPTVGLGGFPADISLARPGGNITGFSARTDPAINGKRIQLLHDAVPTASRIGVVGRRSDWESNENTAALRAGANQLGLTLIPALIEDPLGEATIQQAFKSLDGQNVEAVYFASASSSLPYVELVADLALRTGLPTMTTQRPYTEAGFLMTYGTDIPNLYRGAAGYVDRILAGQNPGELPIQLPMRFDFIINLKTADALGITIPPKIMIFATEFIE